MTTECHIFCQLRDETERLSENRYRVSSLPNRLHKIGVSEEGFPKFFVVTCDHAMMHNLNAELLSVEYNMLCNIIEANVVQEGLMFSIITLRSDNEQLQRTFIDVFLMMLDNLPPEPTNLLLASKIENLISIFAKLKKHPVHKLQGLWAELLLIERSVNPTIVAKAWHSQPNSKYDFTMGGAKLEVKSTQSESRIHHFSLDQLNPSPNSHLLICSTIVRESAKSIGGKSVFDLYDSISSKISDVEIRMHVYNVLIDTLGNDFYSAQKKFFDYVEASDRLALFNYVDIPKIERSIVPEHVAEVKFTSDLSYLEDIREKGFEREGIELYNALY